MDTRTKIVGAAEFNRCLLQWRSEGIQVSLAAGSFDPLLAMHAAQAAAARPPAGRLAIIVTEPANAILDAGARAELTASLAAVDLVTLNAPGLPRPDMDWDCIHASIASRFLAHVLDRMS